jgi:thioredoxin 1
MAPVLEDLAANSGGRVILAKVNVDENPGLADRYGIRAIPTVLLFRGGEVLERITGAVPRAVLQKILNARA